MFLIDKEVAEILIQLYILQQKKTMCQPSSRRQRKRRISWTQGIQVINRRQNSRVFSFLKISKEIGKAWTVLRARSP